jgi:hypothetical protein
MSDEYLHYVLTLETALNKSIYTFRTLTVESLVRLTEKDALSTKKIMNKRVQFYSKR